MKRIISLLAVCIVLTTGCRFDEDYFVDFDNLEDVSPNMFRVTSHKQTSLSGELPDDATLPGGVSANEFIADSLAETKSTYTTASDVVQNFLKWKNKGDVIEISGLYESIDDYDKPVTLSGKLIIPADKPIKRCIVVSHYTIATNAEAPSNTFPLEGTLASLGYAVIEPDYLGYGVTGDRFHPYLLMELSATNVIDMYLAVVPFLKAINREPENDDIYLVGYSQGGATTMAVQYMIERDYGKTSDNPISIKRTFVGGGIYDIKATFESFIETNYASYPCGVPFVLIGQVMGNHLDTDLIYKLVRPEVTDNLEDWFLYKNKTTTQMNKLIGSHQTDHILTDLAFDRESEELSTLYQVMTLNSVVSLAWTPEAPVYMLHSMQDETVPFTNATRAKARWSKANIQYNFGNYGSHVMGFLRFLNIVAGILRDED